jgi:ADP-ribose pyrophosphatase
MNPDTISPQSDDSRPWVKVLDRSTEYSFGEMFHVVRARLRHWRFDGTASEPVTRIYFERGDSVGVLLHDPRHDAVILVRQFRYPVYAGLNPDQRSGLGAGKAWMLEIVAGMVEEGLTVTEVANKELFEEAGFVVKGPLKPIATIYPSPGGTSERIPIYLAEVDLRSRTVSGGGVLAEGEDIQLEVIPFGEALGMVATGEICDAKTIIALQHLALQKARY